MNSRKNCLAVLMLSLAFSGCSQTASEPADILAESTTPAVFNSAGAPTVEFSVPDMMCAESCAVAVEKTLAGQPGVKDVRVDFETKTATVAVDEEKFNADEALAALVDKQFSGSSLKDIATVEPAADGPAIQ